MCGYKADVGEDDSPKEKPKKPKAEPSGFQCPKCGKDLLKRAGKFGDFLGCASYPKCKTTAQLDGTVKQRTGKKWGTWKKKG